MGIKFGSVTGKAKKAANFYEYKDGENTLRLVGDVLPRYVYWIKGADNKDVGIECLGFDREAESFKNLEKDWVRHYYPEKKCSWAYLVQALTADGKLVLVPLKKKLFEQIMTAAEDLGDPTDPDTGWDCVFKKTKTGPMPFNVEYTLQVLRCKKRALSDAEKETLATIKSIDLLVPRPTPDEQRKQVELIVGATQGGGEEVPPELKETADDIPA